MKKQLLSLLFCLTSVVIYAQTNINERTIELSKKEKRNGFQFFIPAANASQEAVEKAIEKKLKSLKARYKESSGVYRAEKTNIDAISDKTIDLIIVAQKDKNNDYTIAAVVGMGYDLSATSSDNPAESSKIRAILTQLYQEIKDETTKQRLEQENDKLADLERNLKKMTSNQTDWQKDIEDYTKKIEDTKNNIAKNAIEMEKLKNQIAEQKKMVEGLKTK